MITQKTFFSIKTGKNNGKNRYTVSKELELSFNTVNKYWEKSLSEFNTLYKEAYNKSANPTSSFDLYYKDILNCLKEFPELSGTQIYSILKKKYKIVQVTPRTIRSYVDTIRKEYDILKPH